MAQERCAVSPYDSKAATMTRADYLACWLLVNYAVVGLAYAWQGDYWRAMYWTGAILIVTATVGMGR